MPRKPRAYVAGVPSHVISRGNDRNPCFFENEDYRFYLECLDDACRRYKVSLHAYVLMTNHVHLLVTPDDKEGVSRVMQSIGRRYVQFINAKYRRSGTLWEGRHKASLVDAEHYLLICYRYIELNPVRANMVKLPSQYRWSSFRENAGLDESRYLSVHEVYRRLDLNRQCRHKAYQALFKDELGERVLQEVRNAVIFSMPLGSSKFQERIEKVVNRKLGYAKRGRPLSQK